ncbi:adhesion G-protein coupled receptor F1 isoform X2 [Tachysurus fulvidraco]|uniref:adhesion G-protein coupled receptor F1 isoform X2 n=1 Tax=Tachysurus fulvidraco TaxID=1234273 RepID=UPI001FEEB61E|nr:adhesion G-protein coupled receptor F1 isoform X2 [Tachysurus fulvidraco]
MSISSRLIYKMKGCGGITLILLGLCIQASSTANTTQAYYFNLQIESSAFENFTQLLGNITEFPVEQATLKHITITTDCHFNNCTCNPDYTWSKDVCAMYPNCCQQNICYAMPTNAMCLHKDRVYVNGSFTIQNGELPQTIDQIHQLQENLAENITLFYSTMNWFDSLNISNLSPGSIIGNLVMLINGPFDMNQFLTLTTDLQNKLNATFNILTTGFIKIDAPAMVGYNTSAIVQCTTPLGTLDDVKWYIQKDTNIQRITNGTEATVSMGLLTSNVSITQTSEVWKGIFICDYTSTKYSSIIHRASVFLDVALLPQILIISDPQFPKCKGPSVVYKVDIKVKCIIDSSNEPYTVNWTKDGEILYSSFANTTTIYTISINCEKDHVVTCTFQNRANNIKSESVIIPVIYHGIWPEAKANYTAKMQCNSNEVGYQTRLCKGLSTGNWDSVISQCVNTDLWTVLVKTQNLQKGCGLVEDNANNLFSLLKTKSEDQVINTFQNINVSVNVFDTLNDASKIQNSTFNESMITDFLKSSSNLLNDSLLDNWQSPLNNTYTLPILYLKAVEGMVSRINVSMQKPIEEKNVQLMICNTSVSTCTDEFNINFTDKTATETVYQTRIKNLYDLLPNYENSVPSEFILSVTANKSGKILMNFPKQRLPNHKIFCVFFNFTTRNWSDNGCIWGGVLQPNTCTCDHFSAFTSLMSSEPVELPYMNMITYTGLGFSICSLVLCLAIEFVVWNTVVKSNISHFRHTVLVNIALCLLLAHCGFLASSTKNSTLSQWCQSLTVLKHFCFLAVFFWMLCMSMGLLHQMIFVFVQLRKKVYLGLCFFLGYVCPLFIVISAVITYDNGKLDSYYVNETCWLKYEGELKGSIHSFVIPVGVIVLVNMFTMVVVISRILKPTLSEGKSYDEKEVVRSVIRTVVLLTPTLGITWIFGFFIPSTDLTYEPFAQIVNYGFAAFNSFQGFFILLTGCFGEKKVRDALFMRMRSQHSADYTSKSSMKMTAAVKKK